MLNKYFKLTGSENTNETNLISNFHAECVQQFGIDFYYLPRTSLNRDDILGEDVLSSFDSYWTIEMYNESFDGFGGQDLITKFGLSIPDEMELSVNVERWKTVTSTNKPKEGDLIYYPQAKALFSVDFVEDELPFYVLGKNYVFKLRCSLYEYDQTVDFNTGVADIDILDNEDLSTLPDDKPGVDNEVIETEASTLLDNTESDPFGGF